MEVSVALQAMMVLCQHISRDSWFAESYSHVSWKFSTSVLGMYCILDLGPEDLVISISGTPAQLWNYVGVTLMHKTTKSIPYSTMHLKNW